MSQATVEKELYEYLSTYWTSTPIAYQNVIEKDWEETGQPLLPSGEKDFISVRIDMHSSKAISVPGTCRREYGSLHFEVWVKQETGTRALRTYIDALIAMFEYTHFTAEGNDLRVLEILTQHTNPTDDGWFVGRISFNLTFNRHVPQ